jgi:hypothetical protein
MEKYDHEICNKVEITEKIKIQCAGCIDKIVAKCTCSERVVKKSVCLQCKEINDKMKSLYSKLDQTLFEISQDMKKFKECDDTINSLFLISDLLRHGNRILLEKQVNDATETNHSSFLG